jgi:hypothetical protein
MPLLVKHITCFRPVSLMHLYFNAGCEFTSLLKYELFHFLFNALWLAAFSCADSLFQKKKYIFLHFLDIRPHFQEDV